MFHHKATSLRVLVVDENPVQQAVLKRILSKHVSEIAQAETAGAAIHLALSCEFDLVLLSGDGASSFLATSFRVCGRPDTCAASLR